MGSDPATGLSEEEAARRLAERGPNALIEQDLRSSWRILRDQLLSVMVLILAVAAAVSALLGDYRDMAAIAAIVVLNAAFGFTQEYRAERALAGLRELAVPRVQVRRGGRIQEISARDLVPGDLILLEAGNRVPADGRLTQGVNLRVQEAALTGESEPVEKDPLASADPGAPPGDRRNMVFMGTTVTYGRGEAMVVATGMDTVLGGVAAMLGRVEREPTPLQRRLDQLGRGLAATALALAGLVFAAGLLRGEALKLMFLTAVSMAVAAVPEGLPVVVTLALALGAQRMLRRRALVRRLVAVETLGSVTVICSDKTGTLTENRLTVTILDVPGHQLDLTEHLHRSAPVVEPGESLPLPAERQADLAVLLAGAALCNDARLEFRPDTPGHFHAVGEPTEGALVVAAARLGLWKGELERAFPRVAEIPFTSERKRMTTIHRWPEAGDDGPTPLASLRASSGGWAGAAHVAFVKGAVDSLLEAAGAVWLNARAEPLDGVWRERIVAAHERLAHNGMRVLGVAFRPLSPPDGPATLDGVERGLIFAGMVAMIDPPRAEVKEAVETCRAAGIRPVMITGDHPLTALHIARTLGIAADGSVLTGRDLDLIPADELGEVADRVSVYARVAPEHKVKIVQALQGRGHVVAMTGDGVNDAPALKKADIGVAMGATGTDVSREAADMVLLDDNFASIVAAVAEGRTIYDNIRKFVRYTLTSNSGEIWTMLLAPFLGMPLPLFPLQILWINLVTDGLPGLALGVEPAERDTMRRPPYRPGENIFGRGMGRHIVWVGLLFGVVSLGVGYWYWRLGRPEWQTMLFTTLTLSQIGHALAIRSERESIFRLGLLSNRALLWAAALTLALQMAVVYVPPLQGVLRTTALSGADLAISLVLSTGVFWAVELEKWVIRRRGRDRLTA